MTGIVEAIASYERWMGERIPLVAADLARKHAKMDADPLTFMRATYPRWAQRFPELCPDAADAPAVLAVGDLHVNNFGVWRDDEGRLTWGVNDLDEAHRLPYTNDLVRLALSAALVDEQAGLAIGPKQVCKAVRTGYERWLREGGRAFVLAEHNDWIRDLAARRLLDPDRFWLAFEGLAPADEDAPPDARAALESLLPEPGLPYRLVRRTAGAGSLGRPRFVALAEWRGGRIAREAKAIVPPATAWLDGGTGHDADDVGHYDELFARAVRSCDPWAARRERWIVRRLAPDCIRIELDSLPDRKRAQARLLRFMGRETANVHLASGPEAAAAVLADLEGRRGRWLRDAVATMVDSVREDWKAWRKR